MSSGHEERLGAPRSDDPEVEAISPLPAPRTRRLVRPRPSEGPDRSTWPITIWVGSCGHVGAGQTAPGDVKVRVVWRFIGLCCWCDPNAGWDLIRHFCRHV